MDKAEEYGLRGALRSQRQRQRPACRHDTPSPTSPESVGDIVTVEMDKAEEYGLRGALRR